MTTVSREVRCTPEQIFAVLGDGWLNGTWEMGTARIRAVDPEWPAPGSQLHHSTGLWPVVIDDVTTVTEQDPLRRLAFQARVRPVGVFSVVIRVVPLTERCRIDITAEAVGGLLNLLPSMVTGIMLRLRNRESLNRLAFLIEGMSTSVDVHPRDRTAGSENVA